MHRLTPTAAALPPTVPFTGPETLERRRGAPFAVRLGANESVFGPAPAAIEAMRAAAAGAWMYGDPEAHELRAAIADRHGVPMDCVVVGEGIDGLLGTLARLTILPGRTAVTSRGAYPTFAYHVAGNGGTLASVPYCEDREDPDALIAEAGRTCAALIYLANPDNPMGSWHSAEAIGAMTERVPDRALLVLDEAYADTAPASAIPPWDVTDPRLIRMRTFSKAHGLAGLRVGYAVGHPDLIAAFDRVRNHFGVGRVAQAGALGRCRIRSTSRAPWRVSPRRASASARSRTRTGSAPCPRPRTSSPSTVAGTARSPRRCSPRSPARGCSCGCPAPRRSIAASGSAPEPRPTWTGSPQRCPVRWRPRGRDRGLEPARRRLGFRCGRSRGPAMRDDRPGVAPDYTRACIVSIGAVIAMALMVIWVAAGFLAALGSAWGLDRLMVAGRRRADSRRA